jgi:hypothetical protein
MVYASLSKPAYRRTRKQPPLSRYSVAKQMRPADDVRQAHSRERMEVSRRCGQITTISAPAGTRSKRSMTSWFSMRTQPEEVALPTDCQSGVPWTR